jgi:hypothetical protein
MAYRSNKDDRLRWNRFLAAYRERLTGLGIPEIALRSERDWYYFIEHEYDFDHPELLNLETWKVEDLEPLLPVFEEMDDDGFYSGGGSGVLWWLRAKLKTRAEQDEDVQAAAAFESEP